MGRDMMKELQWNNHTIIGYVPLDEEGKPYRPTLGQSWWSRRKPITVYQTMANAIKYSPCGSASEVRMFKVDNDGK